MLEDENVHFTNRDMEKAEVFYAFFACLQHRWQTKGVLVPWAGAPQLRPMNSKSNLKLWGDLLLQLDPYKSLGPDGISKPLLISFEQFWEYREVPADWKMATIVEILKEGEKEDPESAWQGSHVPNQQNI